MLLDLTFCVTPHVHRAHSHFEIEFTQVRRFASDLKDLILKTKFTYGKKIKLLTPTFTRFGLPLSLVLEGRASPRLDS